MGAELRFLWQWPIVTFWTSKCLCCRFCFGKGGGIFTAQKLAGNHTKLMYSKPLFQFTPNQFPPPPPFPNHFAPSIWVFLNSFSRVSLSCYYCRFVSEVLETMLVVKNKSISPLWKLSSIFMSILPKEFHCIDHEHGLLVTCLQTKNWLVECSLIIKASQFNQKLRTITTLNNKVEKHWLC